jgi:hypothetical protein
MLWQPERDRGRDGFHVSGQAVLFDLRSETRPLRKVTNWKHVARWKSQALLECGHASKVVVGDNLPKRMRCNLCAAFGNDECGLKYKVPE